MTTTTLLRLRLPLDNHDSVLLVVGDRFEEGGRYVQGEYMSTDGWTWLDWDEAYGQLAKKWRARFGGEGSAG